MRTTVSKYLSLTKQRVLAFLGSLTKSDLEILFAALYYAIPQCKLLIQSCQLTYKTFDLFANCFSLHLARSLTLLWQGEINQVRQEKHSICQIYSYNIIIKGSTALFFKKIFLF